MPFNASGIFQRLFRWQDDRDANIRIRADRMDQEMDGMVDGINQIINADQPFRGPLKTVKGTAAAPSHTFTDDDNTGMYRSSTDELSLSAGGVQIAKFSGTAATLLKDLVKGTFKIDGNFLSFEDGDHWITYNDGAGNFNIRVGHKWGGSSEVYTRDGQGAIHLEFSHEVPAPYFTINLAAPGSLGSTVNWSSSHAFRLDGTTNVNADKLDGQHGSYYQNASNLNAGTVPSSRLSGHYDITVPNISNTGTVTLATATEQNSITITQPSYTADKPVKLLNFNWYSDEWSLGNICHSDSTSQGLGVFNNGTETHRFRSDGLLINGNTAWHTGNDGPGSGMNADFVDGLHASQFIRSDVSQELQLSGGQKRFQSANSIEEPTGAQATLEVYNPGLGNDAFMGFHVAGDYAGYFGLKGDINDFVVGGWSFGSTSYRIWHEGNDGAGSGLDADLLDGLHGSYYQNASNLNAGTVPSSRLSGHYDITVPNISNTGTVTLATATEQNSITITQPSYTADKPVKLLNFNWYSDEWSLGNIRSGSTPSNGFGIFHNGVETHRFLSDGRISSSYGVASTTYNGVGSYIFASNNSGGPVLPGAIVAGSSLRPTSAYTESADGYPLSGTWRCMGYKYGGNTSFNGQAESTLWVRIA